MLKQEIDFLGKRRWAMYFSLTLLLVSVVSLAVKGLVLGIDFTGGTLVEIGYQQPADLSQLRDNLTEAGFVDASVQNFGTRKDVLIRLKPDERLNSSELSSRLLEAVNKNAKYPAEMRRVEFVGPQVGDELAEDGGLALLYAMFGILVYIAWRFEYKFSLGAVAALIHDVTITLGVFSVLNLEFDLTVLAAILAVIGYSLNDTIVVFDRIRDNFRKMRKVDAVQIMNLSLNQTLSRTLMTSFTTVLVLVALAVLGGEIIQNFALALLIGIGIGTYSSIYVASPVVLALGITKEDLMVPEKEGANFDGMP